VIYLGQPTLDRAVAWVARGGDPVACIYPLRMGDSNDKGGVLLSILVETALCEYVMTGHGLSLFDFCPARLIGFRGLGYRIDEVRWR